MQTSPKTVFTLYFICIFSGSIHARVDIWCAFFVAHTYFICMYAFYYVSRPSHLSSSVLECLFKMEIKCVFCSGSLPPRCTLHYMFCHTLTNMYTNIWDNFKHQFRSIIIIFLYSETLKERTRLIETPNKFTYSCNTDQSRRQSRQQGKKN